MRVKTALVGTVMLVAAGVLAMNVTGGAPGTHTDTSERHKYTLVADTSMNRGEIEARVTSSARGNVLTIAPWRKVKMTWKQSVWVEPGEVVKITLRVRTYGDHRLRTQLWSRCQILKDGEMVGGDAEVDNIHIERYEDQKRQTRANCEVKVG